jgi:hypothetical protein
MANDDLLFKAGMDSGDFARGIGGIIKNVEGMALSLLGLGSASLTLKYMADEALKDEKATMALASAVKGLKTGTEEGFLALNKYADAMSEATGIAGEDLKGALKELVFSTGSTEAAQKSLGVTIDLAKAKEISLEAAARIVGKAYDGNTGMLKKYGIEIDQHAKGMTVINELTKKFGGAEDSYLATTQGKLDKAKNSFNMLANEIGNSFLPALGFAADALTKFLKSFTGNDVDKSGLKKAISEIKVELDEDNKKLAEATKKYGENSREVRELKSVIKELNEEYAEDIKKLKQLNGLEDDHAKKQWAAAKGSQENTDVTKASYAEQLSAANIFFKGVSSLTKTKNKELFEIGKAASIASITVSTAEAIMNALAKIPPPFNIAAAAGLAVEGGVELAVASGATFQAREGLFADETMKSTFSPREIVVPQRFSDLIASGKMSLQGGNNSTSNTTHGPVSIIVNGADKSPKQIALEIAHYFKSDRGGRLVRADGSMNM